LREEYENVLILSGGDNLAAKHTRESELQSLFYMEVLGQSGIDATAIQAHDLLMGFDTLLDLCDRHNIPPLCANLELNGETVLPGYRIFEFGGKKLGVLAVTDPRMQHAKDRVPKGMSFVEPQAAVVAGVETLRQQENCDAIILLYGGRRDQAIENCKGVEGIDLILFGNASMSQRVPAETDMGTSVYSAAGRGKDFGEIAMTIKDDGSVELSPIVIHELDKNYRDHKAILAKVNIFKEEAEARKVRKRLIEQIAREFSDTPVTENFLGSATCARCHETEHNIFLATAHARALETLEKEGEQDNPECINCHVTGWEVPGGYGLNDRNKGMLAHVQCEACHGYGTAHQRNNSEVAAVAAASCTRCHNEEWSPDFDYNEYWQRIKH
jgi:2',3'-cyclic-nucleotide 2'-phosphodiesterase (5'-nucleotidase family)